MANGVAQDFGNARGSLKLQILLLLLLLHAGSQFGHAQQPTPPPRNISTVAGGGPTTMPKLNGAASNVASTGEVGQIAWDSTRGVFYFTSSTFHRLYKYDPVAGQATVLAGNGLSGFRGEGGDPLQASFSGPLGLVLDPTNPNTLYVGDTGNNRIRRIDLTANTISTISGDGTCIQALLQYTDVPVASANICAPGQMAMDGNGVLYVFDLTRRVVWRMAGGQARMIAGSSSPSGPLLPVPAGIATTLPLGNFAYLAADPAGQSLYINETIGLRQLNLPTGVLSAPLDVAANTPFMDPNGASTGFFAPVLRDGSPVAVDPATGNVTYAIYTAAAPTTESIFSLNPTTGQKTLLSGTGANAPPFLAPTSNVNLGGITNGLGELVAITPTGAATGTFVASRSGWIHSMDSLTAGANFTTFLGNGFRSYCGDGGPATSACLDTPSSIFANPDGSFFIADTGNSVVRFVDAGGIIHSLISPKAAGAPPTSLTVVPSGVNLPTDTTVFVPAGNLLFTSILRHQVFALDPATDTTTLYSGNGNPACRTLSTGQHFCDNNGDNGLLKAQFDQPRGIVVDPFGNPYLAEPAADSVLCLQCTDPIVGVGADLPGGSTTFIFDTPYALALDTDNGLLVAERGNAQKIQHIAPDPNHGYVTAFFFDRQFLTDILNNRQLPLPNLTPLLPAGLTRIPGLILTSDNYSRIVWSTTRPPTFNCPQNVTCILPPPPPQVVAAFAGGGTDSLDNIPAFQARFGFRQVEAGVFDAQDSLGEIASAQVNSESLVYITDRADNRIRLVDSGANHPPVANAGADRTVPLDSLSTTATVLLDGTASTDPDGDVLSYSWREGGTPLGKGALITANLGLGKHVITLTVADGYGGTSPATVNISVTPPVDLAIAATPSATAVNTGDTLTYNATVTNNGPNDATGVNVTLPVTSATDFVSGTAPGGACTGPAAGASGTITCLVGNLANAGNSNATISVKPHAAGTLASVLSVAGDQGDPDTSNNSLTVTVAVNQTAPVQVTVNETIHVTDAVTPLPSVLLSDAETIHVTDAVTPLPSVLLSDGETIHVADTVTPLPSVMLSDTENIYVTDTPGLTPVTNTPVGSSTVVPPDQNGNPSNVTVTFAGGVTVPGFTSVIISPTGPPLPAGFQLTGNPPVYYDVLTSAQFNAPVVVCVVLNPMPGGAALLHFNPTTQQWENFTVKPVPVTGPICTQVNSLSPFAVVISSNRPPMANAGANQIVEATSAAGASVTLSGSGSDPDNDPLTFMWSEGATTLGTGAQVQVTLPIGVHTITLTADDSRGGTGTSSVLITVQDTKPPVFTPPASQTLEATSPTGAVATFSATATDMVDGVRPMICAPASGSTFPLGTTTVGCSATDLHGNSSSGSFTITVRDTAPPVVMPPASITIPATEAGGARGSAWPALAAFLAAGLASDIADLAPARLAPQVAGVNADNNTLYPFGTTAVTFPFRDASNNVGSATATVTVILGIPKISSRIAGQGSNPDGTYFVDVALSNSGNGNARKLKVDLVIAVPIKGFGRITVVSPAFPMTVGIGNLDVSETQTIHVVLRIPSTVKQFVLAEAGNFVNVKGVPNLFAVEQTVTP